MTGAIRSQSASIAPISKSAPSGLAISSATKSSGLAAQAAHQLTDQVALVLRVIARRGSGFPPRRLGGQLACGSVPVVMSSMVNGASQPDTPEVAENVPDLDALFRSPRTPASTWRPARWIEEPPVGHIRAARLVTVLVVDHTLVMVFSVHGVCPRRTSHPQIGHGPPAGTSTAMLAPVVARVELSGEHVPTGSNRASQVPCTSTTGVSPSSLNDMTRGVAAGRYGRY